MTEDDLALVPRAAGGDDLAFEVLVRRHTDAIWRLTYGMLHDRHAAEDATQETFLKAHRALGAFRSDSSFKTWLLSIAHRTCLDTLRRQQPAVTDLEAVRDRRARGIDEATRVALESAVSTLPDDERQAFLLVDALGLSREEAAGVVGVPASTLKSRLARAHSKLVASLDADAVPTKRKRTR